MQLPKRRSNSEVGFNMTPMIDVVFLLITFFLVATYLSRQERRDEIELAQARSASRDSNAEQRRVIITVEPDGQYRLGSKEIDLEGLKSYLEEEREKSANIEVRVRADRRCPFEFVEPLLIACASNGITQLKFHVISEEE